MSNSRRAGRVGTVAVLAMWFSAAAVAQEPAPPAAQPKEPNNYSTWVRRQVHDALLSRAEEKAIAENGNGLANQKESPSIDQASTSLVDTSSASDFASLALNLTGLRRGTGGSEQTSGSVTASLYSLVAAAKGVALTNPTFYRRGAHLRRLSLTIGSGESTLADHFTDKPSTNIGFKLVLLNDRDVYSTHARTQLNFADAALADYVVVEQMVTNDLQCIIFRAVHPEANRSGRFPDCRADPAFVSFLKTSPFDETNWPKTQASLEKNNGATLEIQQVIATLATGRRVATERITAAVEQIQRGRQLAFAYYTKQRQDDGTDEHRAELIFDYGLSERLNWTVNASLDYSNRTQLDDLRKGRIATEFQSKLTAPGTQTWSARPVMLSGSAEASKDPDSEWLVRAQAKLTFPVVTGVEIPISYTYASRDAEGISGGSEIKLSFSLDPVRLRERFK